MFHVGRRQPTARVKPALTAWCAARYAPAARRPPLSMPTCHFPLPASMPAVSSRPPPACHSPPLPAPTTRRPRPARPSLAHLSLAVRFTFPTFRWLRFPLAAFTRPTHASLRPLRAAVSAKTHQPLFSDAALQPSMPSLSPLARAPSSQRTPATALVLIFFCRARVHAQVLAPLIYVLYMLYFSFPFLHVGTGSRFVSTVI
ncbi:hypothetical protein GGX14DRAFT_476446 [Mycena pura]|uniref:Uncharacterized protein n=1 Tax=Mycena pura TaxID=153505 RepID=A0AAD6Y795_9AGAR|nr:hypothetical protein GGX14DRAFT_476446 [Mycena pura]